MKGVLKVKVIKFRLRTKKVLQFDSSRMYCVRTHVVQSLCSLLVFATQHAQLLIYLLQNLQIVAGELIKTTSNNVCCACTRCGLCVF